MDKMLPQFKYCLTYRCLSLSTLLNLYAVLQKKFVEKARQFTLLSFQSILLCLSGCSSFTFHTNLDENYIANEVAHHGLYKFYSGQEANESGAKLIGTATGFSCLPYNPLGYEQYEISQLKGLAIDNLKQDILRLGANAYLVEQCHDYSNNSNECDKGQRCVGQAYDY